MAQESRRGAKIKDLGVLVLIRLAVAQVQRPCKGSGTSRPFPFDFSCPKAACSHLQICLQDSSQGKALAHYEAGGVNGSQSGACSVTLMLQPQDSRRPEQEISWQSSSRRTKPTLDDRWVTKRCADGIQTINMNLVLRAISYWFKHCGCRHFGLQRAWR